MGWRNIRPFSGGPVLGPVDCRPIFSPEQTPARATRTGRPPKGRGSAHKGAKPAGNNPGLVTFRVQGDLFRAKMPKSAFLCAQAPTHLRPHGDGRTLDAPGGAGGAWGKACVPGRSKPGVSPTLRGGANFLSDRPRGGNFLALQIGNASTTWSFAYIDSGRGRALGRSCGHRVDSRERKIQHNPTRVARDVPHHAHVVFDSWMNGVHWGPHLHSVEKIL